VADCVSRRPTSATAAISHACALRGEAAARRGGHRAPRRSHHRGAVWSRGRPRQSPARCSPALVDSQGEGQSAHSGLSGVVPCSCTRRAGSRVPHGDPLEDVSQRRASLSFYPSIYSTPLLTGGGVVGVARSCVGAVRRGRSRAVRCAVAHGPALRGSHPARKLDRPGMRPQDLVAVFLSTLTLSTSAGGAPPSKESPTAPPLRRAPLDHHHPLAQTRRLRRCFAAWTPWRSAWPQSA
jgi:hypothetical protein